MVSVGGRGWLHLEPAQSANTIATCQSCYTLIVKPGSYPTITATHNFGGIPCSLRSRSHRSAPGKASGEIVAEAVRVVRDSGLPNQTDAMFTTVEGDWVGFQ